MNETGVNAKIVSDKEAYTMPVTVDKDLCIGCGACEPMCPQKIRIPREMHRIAEYVEELKQDKVTSLSDQAT